MQIDCINHNDTGFFTNLLIDYLNEKKDLSPLYNRFPKLDNFKDQINEKYTNYSLEDRLVLQKAIKEQYKNIDASGKTIENIELLKLSNTFTITTGHQLNLFTGPIYYLYKILSVINLSEKLKQNYPQNNFVPVFWMATEDHDFEEINHFKFKDKKIFWNSLEKGPVGRFTTTGLDKLLETLKNEFGKSDKATFLINLFKESYLKNDNLADATFFLTNELFKKFGIVIVNGDSNLLKENFKNSIIKELKEEVLFKEILTSTQYFKEYYVQVNPREINLFYIKNGLRERIVKVGNTFKILNTDLSFEEKDFINLLNTEPESFSPNAIFRPLFQEKVLPNLAYIGGGGELAYWLELKSSFKAFNITFPMLIHRDSVLLVTNKINEKINRLNIKYQELFLKKEELISLKTKQYSENLLDFNDLKKQLDIQFKKLNETAKKTDVSFKNALDAQYKKQTKGLENLEKKLLRAEKKLLKDKVDRIIKIKDELFPDNNLQERKQNFAEFYLDANEDLIDILKKELDPLETGFKIILI